MQAKKILGILLLTGGILALVYGGFSYTQEEHQVDIGPVEFSVKDKETVNIPLWLGVVSTVAGVVLLATGGRR